MLSLCLGDPSKFDPTQPMYAVEALTHFGVEAAVKPVPEGVPAGVKQYCFYNALMLAMENPDYTYVEGYAYYMIPIHHAWVVDTDGKVIDNTWSDLSPCYYGVPFKTEAVAEIAMRTKMYSVLFNHKVGKIKPNHIHLATFDKLSAINCNGI